MARTDLDGAGAPLQKSVTKTPHDHLQLPDGRRIGDVRDLGPLLVSLAIPGAEVSAGRTHLIERYATHLHGIHEAAGKAAVAAWLAERRNQ